MKNYPLNPFQYKVINWQSTYLKELNTKIFALRNYSEFFLTDFIQTNVDLKELTIKTGDGDDDVETIYVIQIETLDFHNYAYISKNCYLETDETDDNAVIMTDIEGNIHYLRKIDAGTTIISKARPEGSINANGIQSYNLIIQALADPDPSDPDPEPTYTWVPLQIEGYLVGFLLPAYGPAHPDRSNWRNFVIQPTGYASLYTVEPTDGGIRFIYSERGGEEYGTELDLLLLVQNARFSYIGMEDNIKFTLQKGVSITAKSSENLPLIATKIKTYDAEAQDYEYGQTHWVARRNPVMHFMYYGRTRSSTSPVFGEEIITDSVWSVGTTKLATVNTLVYNIDIDAIVPSGVNIQADLI